MTSTPGLGLRERAADVEAVDDRAGRQRPGVDERWRVLGHSSAEQREAVAADVAPDAVVDPYGGQRPVNGDLTPRRVDDRLLDEVDPAAGCFDAAAVGEPRAAAVDEQGSPPSLRKTPVWSILPTTKRLTLSCPSSARIVPSLIMVPPVCTIVPCPVSV